MSSTVINAVPTTASRFALLQVESDTESENGKGRSGHGASKSQASQGRSSTNEKIRKKRRKKKEQQKSETNEKSSCGGSLSQHQQKLRTAMQRDSQKENWQEWRQRDEQLTSEMFEADLEKALLLSKLEYEEHKKITFLKNMMLEDDVHRILEREKRRVQLTDCSETDNSPSNEHSQESVFKDRKIERLKLELEKKDAEIEQLKNTVTQWEAKYKEVKTRNAQLLKMMQEGEMKDKAEILLQVDESQVIKNELTIQVTMLHTALEKERSKVKLLQAELTKYQTGKKGKRNLKSDQCR